MLRSRKLRAFALAFGSSSLDSASLGSGSGKRPHEGQNMVVQQAEFAQVCNKFICSTVCISY